MSEARNNLLATREHIRSLKIAIAVLLIVIVALWWRNGLLQETRRIYVPPNLTEGTMTTFGEVPFPVVYTFAWYIFQQLNRWKTDGEQDYPKQIYRLQGFLTPDCIAALEHDMNEKRRLGELRNRVRMMQEIAGRGYSSQRVQVENADRWTVLLDLHLRETIAHHDVKNVNLRYTLPVVKFDVDREVNPWGLAIACDKNHRPQLLGDESTIAANTKNNTEIHTEMKTEIQKTSE